MDAPRRALAAPMATAELLTELMNREPHGTTSAYGGWGSAERWDAVIRTETRPEALAICLAYQGDGRLIAPDWVRHRSPDERSAATAAMVHALDLTLRAPCATRDRLFERCTDMRHADEEWHVGYPDDTMSMRRCQSFWYGGACAVLAALAADGDSAARDHLLSCVRQADAPTRNGLLSCRAMTAISVHGLDQDRGLVTAVATRIITGDVFNDVTLGISEEERATHVLVDAYRHGQQGAAAAAAYADRSTAEAARYALCVGMVRGGPMQQVYDRHLAAATIETYIKLLPLSTGCAPLTDRQCQTVSDTYAQRVISGGRNGARLLPLLRGHRSPPFNRLCERMPAADWSLLIPTIVNLLDRGDHEVAQLLGRCPSATLARALDADDRQQLTTSLVTAMTAGSSDAAAALARMGDAQATA